jgi:hypothetical protein
VDVLSPFNEYDFKCDNCLYRFHVTAEDINMGTDLFVMLSNNKVNGVVRELEGRVAELIASRHEYPIWPYHDSPLDSYEESYHGSIRHQYYYTTILMIQTLRGLRSLT